MTRINRALTVVNAALFGVLAWMVGTLAMAAMINAVATRPAPAATAFATPSTLDATLKAARPGDTVILAGPQPFGAPGSVWRGLNSRSFNPPLTIDATGATINSQWYLFNVSGLNIKGGTFECHPSSAAPLGWVGGFRMDQLNNGLRPADITLDGVAFTGPRVNGQPVCGANAVHFVRSDRVTVKNSTFDAWRYGVVLTGVDGFDILSNVGSAMRSDFIQMNRSDNGNVDANDYSGLTYVVGAEHPDPLQGQGWALAGSTRNVINLRITRNVFRGNSQGIFLADGCFSNVLIEGNQTEVAMSRGISVACGSNITVRNNQVRTAPYAVNPSGLFLPASAARCGNTVASFTYGGKSWAGGKDIDCLIPLPATPAGF